MHPTQLKTSTSFTLYPLLWLSICLAGGILTAKVLIADWWFFLAVCLFFAFLTIVFLKEKFAPVFLSFAFFAFGAFCFQTETESPGKNRLKTIYDENRINSGNPIEVEGILKGEPEIAPHGFFLKLKAEKAIYKGTSFDVSGNIRLFAPVPDERFAAEYEQLNLQNGSRIRVACHLRREEEFLNPGVIPRKELLDQRDVDATATVKSPLLLEEASGANVFTPLTFVYQQRQRLVIDFKEKFNRPTAGILIASLLGNRHFLDRHTAEIFREGGTFHVLVISGLHITFIGGLMLLLLRFFTKKRLWQFVIAAAFLWAYALAVGADAPVIRAALMFSILLFSQVLFRQGTLLNALGACALLLLVWRPGDLFNPSFQLTFVSVAAIVAVAFPLIENLRSIGSWSPTAEMPFPPNVSVSLKWFCETLYWRERIWEIEQKRQIWSAHLFKSPHLKWLETKGAKGIFRYVFEAFLVSLIVQVWLLPLLVFYFHRLPIAAIFLNLWVGVFIALESFAALLAVLFAHISNVLALPLIRLTEMLNWLLLSVPNLLVESSWASMRLPIYPGAMKTIYLLYFVPVLLMTLQLGRWSPFALERKPKSRTPKFFRFLPFGILLFFILLIVSHPFSSPAADGKLRVDFLDVGQGDAALITFPDGATLLVDGGGRGNFNRMKLENDEEIEDFEPDTPSIGEKVVSEFLWEKGYSKIDYILATHADADHLQGLGDVAKNFRVQTAFVGRMPVQNQNFVDFLEILQNRQIEILKLSRGDLFDFGKARVEVLHPANDDLSHAVSDNNDSLVLRLSYGEISFLLTGDIENETESKLVQENEITQTDVIKVAHHGSRTSSTAGFVNAARAKIAIISVGRKSPFGHPHDEVVERWQNAGALVLTTGERGTISISTDGKELMVHTFIP